ncbi:Uu.00g017900.m01.CDS01 [Anthostomella pinea]|uniref:Uu.00g017900.m01.CDS01 n=1 Tax=Anthostomella pinea TaxID=933095 RepID=A0AAI8YQP6_9PEZI|nr:Uu.00g017900.m01.CDS01 [Anthostomella pinea]
MIGSERHASVAPAATILDAARTTANAASDLRHLSHPERALTMPSTSPRKRTSQSTRTSWTTRGLLVSILSSAPLAMAQDGTCVSLSGSTTCPAFDSASVSTSSYVYRIYPFLQYVTDTASFDKQLTQYVQGSYAQEKYQNLLGCGSVDLSDADLYARFTISVICNGIVQNSIDNCTLSAEASRPLCADSCAQYAESESYIAADRDLCPTTGGSNLQSQIRADFVNCALPANAISSNNCIQGIANEPNNCGYGDSTLGLCSYCSSGGINSTDTCCYNSNVEDVCQGVVLPTITPTVDFNSSMPTATPSSTPAAATSKGLSGGAIAGIVIGSLVGALLLAFLLFMCIRLARRRHGSQKGSVFNQPAPSRKGPQASQIPANAPPQGYEVLPGGRIARMSALEGHSGASPSIPGGSRPGVSAGAAAAGAAGGYMAGRRRGDNHSSSDSFGDSPNSEMRAGVLRPPPTNPRRNGSLSSNSVLVGEDPQSPTSAGGMSSAPGINSQQSEQLPFFKDYYSQDDIHPGHRVAVLWAYQPRAADEFALERGDMLKVVGIWDDGWATGILMDERADEWEARRQAQRDSGVSNTSGRGREESPPASGEIKAFPLVCVCLPEHWRKTIEGDGSTETGSSAHQGSQHT